MCKAESKSDLGGKTTRGCGDTCTDCCRRPRAHGIGCFWRLKAVDEDDARPFAPAVWIVRRPCSCLWASLLLSLALSVGGVIALANAVPPDADAGPLRFEGLDYPNKAQVSKNIDALAMAIEKTELARIAYENERSATRRRRLRSERGEEAGARQTLRSLATSLFASRTARGRHLQSEQQYQQEKELAVAALVYKSEGDTVFDDAGLAELCSLHATVLTAADYADYCRKYFVYEVGGVRHSICETRFTPLSFFYGGAEYDIEQIDLAVFEYPHFDPIAVAVINGRNASAAYPPAEVAAVTEVVERLFGYLSTAWTNGSANVDPAFDCPVSQKKDIAHVLAVTAQIRAHPPLERSMGGIINAYFDENFRVGHLKSKYTRANFDFGGPLAGYENLIDDAEKRRQESEFNKWWDDSGLNDATNADDPNWRALEPLCLVSTKTLDEMLKLLAQDGSLAIFPILLVFLIVWLQSRSLLIAAATLVEMLISLPCAIFFTCVILQIQWVSFEQFLTLYIVLAIGADDVFVFVDAYKQSLHAGALVNASLEVRMSWVYRRAGLAMLITSLTTAAAFVATAASSPIPTLQNFGVFAALVVLIDYALVMTWLCSCVVLYHNHFERKPGCCCACCTCAKPGSEADKTWLCSAATLGGCAAICGQGGGYETSTSLAARGAVGAADKSRVTVFFEDTFPFNLVIKRRPVRFGVMALFVAILGPAIWQATLLQPQTSSEQFLPPSHPFQRYFTYSEEFYAADDDRTAEMQIVWGFEADVLDMAGVNLLFKPDNKGTPLFSSSFALDGAAQLGVLAACAHLKASDQVKREYNRETQQSEHKVACFMEAFRDHRLALNQSFPIASAAEASAALLEWLTSSDVADEPDEPDGGGAPTPRDYEDDLGYVRGADGGMELRWVKVRADSLLKLREYLPAKELRKYYDVWEGIVSELNDEVAEMTRGAAAMICLLTTRLRRVYNSAEIACANRRDHAFVCTIRRPRVVRANRRAHAHARAPCRWPCRPRWARPSRRRARTRTARTSGSRWSCRRRTCAWRRWGW